MGFNSAFKELTDTKRLQLDCARDTSCHGKYFFFSMALRPNAGHGLLILEVSRSHTTTHHSR